MKDLLFYNIYTIIFYKCDIEFFNFFRRNLQSGFIMERVVNNQMLESLIKAGGRFFIIIDCDCTEKDEISTLFSASKIDLKKYILYFGNTEYKEHDGFFYFKTENEKHKAVNYIKTLSQQEIFTNTYNNLIESVEYAGKIQKAILPDVNILSDYFSEYFIYNKPRDIVSGDFFWLANIKDIIFVAAGDCTGHGVPGAFMSILGITLLNEIVHVDGHYETDIILNNLRENIIKSLSQSFEGSDVHDGMDIAICAFRPEYDIMQFSGAFNPVVIIREDELIELRADKMPVGIFIKEDLDFSKEYFDLKKDDQIYMFSDGFSDQIGGPHSKKLRKNRFFDLLFEIKGLSQKEQYKHISDYMDIWRGSNEQMDDMLVIGLKI